ncbi:MAG: uncharacterized protein QOJ75_479 [Chloroflexota bacterium]|jgi:uncharacterized protein (DUF1684 family)|nr:uncharacterized protein [Chloroflexota bacterium]
MTHDDHAHDHGHEHEHEHDHAHDYATDIAEQRAGKDEYFRTSRDSPIPAEKRAGFTGLPYFPADPAYRFEGLRLQPYDGTEPPAFQIPTSDGQLRPARRAGTFTFELGGNPRSLTAYVLPGGDSLFVPFLDKTSASETYGAGRYLDLEPDEDGAYDLDFNLAYHPYCVYAEEFSCPLTPAENRLDVRIEAGERL